MEPDSEWAENFISVVQKYPILYNKAVPDFSNRDKKYNAWSAVCEQVVRDWGTLSLEQRGKKCTEIQQRWKNLRSCFARELREQKKGTSGQAAKKRKKYVYFDQLMFLIPTLEERATCSDLSPPVFSSQGEVLEDEIYTNDDEEDIGQSRPPHASGTKHKKKSSFEDSLLNILKEKKDDAEDADKSFLMSLLPTLKKLSDDQKLEAKIDIMQVLRRYTQPQHVFLPQHGAYNYTASAFPGTIPTMSESTTGDAENPPPSF